jgi:hypothetical protein
MNLFTYNTSFYIKMEDIILDSSRKETLALHPPPAAAPPPSTPSLRRRRWLRSSGEALATLAAACLYPRLGERVGALLVPSGGAPRKTSVQRGQEVVVRWRLVVARGAGQHAAMVAIDGCLAPIWQPGPHMGLDGPRWALAGWGAALRGAFCRGRRRHS